MKHFTTTRLAITALAALLWCAVSLAPAFANDVPQTDAVAAEIADKDPYGINTVPPQAQGIGVDDNIGAMIRPDIPFHDHENRFVKIGDYFDGERPVLLSFNYSNCPKLCSVQLENMVATLARIKFRVGTDFQMVSVSMDPTEQTSRARQNKDKYAFMYNKGESLEGFHFLTGDREDIRYLADSCGFRFKYVPEQKLYSHPPVFMLVSPQGKIVRYIHGLDYDPDTMETALIESAAGKIGSPINQFAYGLLSCFSFDETKGRYTLEAMAAMRIGGGLTAIALICTLAPYWWFRRNQHPPVAAADNDDAAPLSQ